MLKKTLLFLVILAVIVAGVFLLASRLRAPSTANEVEVNNDTAQTEETMNTWAEVLTGGASLKQADGTLVELKSGDEISDGAVVVTDENGLVIVHLPDGSSVEIDSSSEAKFDQAQFDDNSESLKVRITLAAGKIWSKIIELATPESYWEVKTTNAVAAVRGTAFGMEYAEGDTQIIGSENTVEVQAVDPDNNNAAVDAPVKVLPNKILIIRRKMLADLRERRLRLADEVKDINAELLERPFVKQAILRNRILNQKIQKWREAGMSRLEIRRALRRELLENRRMILRAIIERLKAGQMIMAPSSGTENLTGAVLVPTGAGGTSGSGVPDTATDSGTTDSSDAGSATSGDTGAAAPTTGGTGGTTGDTTTTLIDTRPASATETNLGPYFFDQSNLVL